MRLRAVTTTRSGSLWPAGGARTDHGATDDFGIEAIEKLMHVHDIHATILYLMSIDHLELTAISAPQI